MFVFSNMNIVILDGYNTNPGDLLWSAIESLGELSVYDRTPEALVVERALNASVVIVNKVKMTAVVLEQLPKLKLICLLATGYDNIDIDNAKALNIAVCNAPGYGVQGVSQHVFAMLLHVLHNIHSYNEEAHHGVWSSKSDFSYWNAPIEDLSTKTLGIYGLGKIGSAVAKIGLAFGMRVISHSRSVQHNRREVSFVDWNTLLNESDVLSLRAPLSEANREIINEKTLQKMKSNCILINTARGGLINESDLKNALNSNQIKAACLDVLQEEPPSKDHLLFGVKNCFITPHQAWASQKSRSNIIDITAQNIQGFLTDHPINKIV